MRSPIVALDLDGVLLDFDSAWHECAEWTLCREVPQITDAYALRDRYGLRPREIDQVWKTFHRDGWWERVPMYEHAWDLIESLEAAGCSLWAVTNVDARHLDARAISLQGTIPYGRIVALGHHAGPEDRIRVLRDLKASAFLDDRSDHANAAAPHVATTALIDRGYSDLPAVEHGVVVIDDIRDFAEIIDRMLAA
jgi:FMN phosphatase YigB (HAD superfamily)